MNYLYLIGFLILNVIITVCICGYMNQKTAEQLINYHYDDIEEIEKRFILIEHWINKYF